MQPASSILRKQRDLILYRGVLDISLSTDLWSSSASAQTFAGNSEMGPVKQHCKTDKVKPNKTNRQRQTLTSRLKNPQVSGPNGSQMSPQKLCPCHELPRDHQESEFIRKSKESLLRARGGTLHPFQLSIVSGEHRVQLWQGI